MRNKHILIKSFTLIFSMVAMLILSCTNVKAMFYERSENKVTGYSTSTVDDNVKVSIQYQNGIKGVEVYICKAEANDEYGCQGSQNISKFVDSDVSDRWLINKSDNVATYNKTFVTPTEGKSIIEYDISKVNTYKILVKARFCINPDSAHSTCTSEDSQVYTKFEEFHIDQSFTSSGEVNKTIKQVLDIVNTFVIPILWVLLAVLLITRGIILGMAIVKSSDEPEVRKSKINGLIWLFVGVGIGYVVTISASIVMGFFGFGGLFS